MEQIAIFDISRLNYGKVGVLAFRFDFTSKRIPRSNEANISEQYTMLHTDANMEEVFQTSKFCMLHSAKLL